MIETTKTINEEILGYILDAFNDYEGGNDLDDIGYFLQEYFYQYIIYYDDAEALLMKDVYFIYAMNKYLTHFFGKDIFKDLDNIVNYINIIIREVAYNFLMKNFKEEKKDLKYLKKIINDNIKKDNYIYKLITI